MPQLHFTFRDNGPLKLEITPNKESFENILFSEESQNITIKTSVFFCRCGQSKKQPYCDGTHKRIGFNDKKEISNDTLQHYEGKDISITFNRSICSGAAQCVEKYSHIYSSEGSTDWIFPDKGNSEEIKQSIINCPSGALSFQINQKQSSGETYEKSRIDIVKKGPLHIKGDITLEGISFSTNANKQKYSLCRCGASQNKPFCDYSHASLKGEEYTF